MPLANPRARVAVSEIAHHSDGAWNVHIHPDAKRMMIGDLAQDLRAVDAKEVHLRGPGAYEAEQEALLGLRIGFPARIVLHVPAQFHCQRWWAIADEIVAHVTHGISVSTAWAYDQQHNRPMTFTHCPLD